MTFQHSAELQLAAGPRSWSVSKHQSWAGHWRTVLQLGTGGDTLPSCNGCEVLWVSEGAPRCSGAQVSVL